ncbi:type I secretion system permease/ATPase [Neptunomonas antarctica]|uniref:ATP-binding cassette, subfamily C, exporter for protease/lipase n=1 Tax=Neptunomonas antarctica TaxID=619304 RepID=A0A1N7N3Y9_9GAMM|nr:type I secretion system permease/ATPase [Neptunomonas antarctica]SIS93050.1 ATP-binding cassette, subfamily C, exporter for protease/lipase [Neptunomonas antarctica]
MNKSKISGTSELKNTLLGMRRIFIATGVFSFFINMLMLVPALYMMQVYDRVLASRNASTLLMLTLLMLFLYIVMAGLEWIRSELLVRASSQLDDSLKNRVFVASFESILKKAGGNPGQSLNDLNNVRQFLTGNGLFAFFDAPWAPIFLLVIALLHPLLALLALVGALLLVSLTFLTEKLTQKPLEEANKAAMQAANSANNSLKNAEVIEAMGMLPGLRQRWYARHKESIEYQQLASNRAGRISALTKFVRIALQSLILGVGAWLAIDDIISPGAMIAASILMGRALAPVELAIGSWKGFVSSRSAYARLEQLLEKFPVRDDPMVLPAPKGVIVVENVTALVPGTQAVVLKGINVAIGQGDVVAVIGSSASGKSSLARLLVGVWPAAMGKVRLDGADIYSWNKLELGQYIGYLPQDIELFEGTIAENIARFGEVDSVQVVNAAQRAGVHDMILHFPQGYDTPIGEAGGFLSGGQRQRIGLARAMYCDPVLIVLDEPNSNLDEQGEVALVGAVKAMKTAGSTVVVITHRTNIVSVVDKILVLQEGGVKLFGPKAEVLAALRTPTPQTPAAVKQIINKAPE